jgi:DMSO/TMAO reductase YedYZ molybdopterin-dependent catalytic subunit
MTKSCYSLALVLLISFTTVVAQTIGKPFFIVTGEVLNPLKLTVDDLMKLNTVQVNTTDREGKTHVYTGVKLSEILDSAGVTLGKELNGENLAKYILIKAADGYEVIFSLPEVDPEFNEQNIILAYQVDGNPLPKGEGPFRMVVPDEKRLARWIRELTTIKVVFSKE